ncbi:MAG: LicD family protein [Erysipelotrichaceae bacterium]|nr:LicD family protein [Erysipelotrichaceae bacterium]
MDIDILLNKIHKIEIDALIEIKKICDENNIDFFLRGGSVLGAVKYGGFVPWDDDIDLAFPRNEYEKLIEIMPKNINDKFLFISYQHEENAHCYFPRIILKDEVRKKLNLPKNNERGLVLIDILPIDGMPNNKLMLQIHIIKAYFYRILASLWTLDVTDTVNMHDSSKQKILKILYNLKIHHLYKQDDIYKKLDKLYSKYSYGLTSKSGMLASSKLKKEVVPSNWWQDGKIVSFENIMVKIPKEYNEYLLQLFGENYASYEPQKEERNKSHLFGFKSSGKMSRKNLNDFNDI